MSLANGRPYLAIPGPSVMPDKVIQAMMRPSPNIYEGELHDVTHSLIPDLKMVAQTQHEVAIYIGNGHAAWEASLANVLSRGDRILVLANGRFGHGWSEVAAGLHIDIVVEDFGMRASVDPARVTDILKADSDHTYKAVLMVHVDTSTGAKSDVAAVRAAIDAAGHPALFMVDCIASLGCDEYRMDDWGVDVTVSACQKGLMTPAGLGFVWFNDKADKARDTADLASGYWNWRTRARPQQYYQYFAGTAPTHHLYGLRAALDMIKAEGIEQIWDRHTRLSQAVWAAIDAWSATGPMEPNMATPAGRGHSVTSIYLGEGNGDRLRAWCETETGVTLGIGLGRAPESAWFRIGHMGHVNAHMVLGTLAVIEAGLTALDIPHGSGALDAAVRALG